MSFSNAWKWKVKVKSLSHVRLLANPWTAAYQAPPSMGFSRQEYWSGLPLPSPPGYVIGMNSHFVASSWQLIKPREWWLYGRILDPRALNFRKRKKQNSVARAGHNSLPYEITWSETVRLYVILSTFVDQRAPHLLLEHSKLLMFLYNLRL